AEQRLDRLVCVGAQRRSDLRAASPAGAARAVLELDDADTVASVYNALRLDPEAAAAVGRDVLVGQEERDHRSLAVVLLVHGERGGGAAEAAIPLAGHAVRGLDRDQRIGLASGTGADHGEARAGDERVQMPGGRLDVEVVLREDVG